MLNSIGNRDVTLVERFQRLSEHTQMKLGLTNELMKGWKDAVEALIMNPPSRIDNIPHAVAMVSLLRDAGQRRFRIFSDHADPSELREIFNFLGHPGFLDELLDSAIVTSVGKLRSPTPRVRWGFLDVKQVEGLLLELFGNDSFRVAKTAAIAGRLSKYARHEAERALLEVGIETQNSVSHNIDYLVIGSKGTGGTKHDKVQALQEGGHKINVLDEAGFEALIHSPKAAPSEWPEERKQIFEQFVCALRHVWAFDLDIYMLSYEYNPDANLL
ncbi:MAG: BRCT domain-containing protein [Myxococcota bacterium]|nr:BRCT domain-containing protein [Myxococcota bacterium]